jgi:hypothetical protein
VRFHTLLNILVYFCVLQAIFLSSSVSVTAVSIRCQTPSSNRSRNWNCQSGSNFEVIFRLLLM